MSGPNFKSDSPNSLDNTTKIPATPEAPVTPEAPKTSEETQEGLVRVADQMQKDVAEEREEIKSSIVAMEAMLGGDFGEGMNEETKAIMQKEIDRMKGQLLAEDWLASPDSASSEGAVVEKNEEIAEHEIDKAVVEEIKKLNALNLSPSDTLKQLQGIKADMNRHINNQEDYFSSTADQAVLQRNLVVINEEIGRKNQEVDAMKKTQGIEDNNKRIDKLTLKLQDPDAYQMDRLNDRKNKFRDSLEIVTMQHENAGEDPLLSFTEDVLVNFEKMKLSGVEKKSILLGILNDFTKRIRDPVGYLVTPEELILYKNIYSRLGEVFNPLADAGVADSLADRAEASARLYRREAIALALTSKNDPSTIPTYDYVNSRAGFAESSAIEARRKADLLMAQVSTPSSPYYLDLRDSTLAAIADLASSTESVGDNKPIDAPSSIEVPILPPRILGTPPPRPPPPRRPEIVARVPIVVEAPVKVGTDNSFEGPVTPSFGETTKRLNESGILDKVEKMRKDKTPVWNLRSNGAWEQVKIANVKIIGGKLQLELVFKDLKTGQDLSKLISEDDFFAQQKQREAMKQAA